MDNTLARRAVDADADLCEQHTVVDLDEKPDHVVVTVARPDGTHTTMEAKTVAGCDGPTSRVRDRVELDAPAELLHGVLALTDTPDDGDRVDVHLTAPTFFAWRIPRGAAGVEYGLAAQPGAEVGSLFDELTQAYSVEPSRRCSGAIPIGPPDSVTTDRVFLIEHRCFYHFKYMLR